MSASNDTEDLTLDIDNDVLIEEVELRPALFDKTLPEYAKTDIRRQLWEEVCSKVFWNSWECLTSEKREKAVFELQKRWTNLRASFTRELRVQRATQSAKGKKRRRKYTYYDKLCFLLPSIEQRSKQSNVSADERQLTQDDNSTADDEMDETFGRQNFPERPRLNLPTKHNYQDTLPSAVFPGQDNYDPDTNFALSLVPWMRRFSPTTKLDVQIQMLQLLKQASEGVLPNSASTFSSQSSVKVQRKHRRSPNLYQNSQSPPPATSSSPITIIPTKYKKIPKKTLSAPLLRKIIPSKYKKSIKSSLPSTVSTPTQQTIPSNFKQVKCPSPTSTSSAIPTLQRDVRNKSQSPDYYSPDEDSCSSDGIVTYISKCMNDSDNASLERMQNN